ncbi:MAG: L,D-transpeptidase family protein [Pseudomonadota bacterium]|nr:L,D-transpeptidase family protein [Pseudomonadota bacterium]
MVDAEIVVRGSQLFFRDKIFRCAIGKGGFSKDKKEGDGCTPLGIFSLRECWYRADRLAAPQTGLPLRVIHENDGWCDDPASKEYNRHIIIPPPIEGRLGGGLEGALPDMPPPQPSPCGGGSYERLWRENQVYDLILPIGYNDDPVIPGRGSAIFMHIAKPDYASTEGCVALAKEDLLAILHQCDKATIIEIKE